MSIILYYLLELFKINITNIYLYLISAFNLDNPSKDFIINAKNKYSLICDSLGIELREFLKFGRNLCKSHDISPDSIMQLAFQVRKKMNNDEGHF